MKPKRFYIAVWLQSTLVAKSLHILKSFSHIVAPKQILRADFNTEVGQLFFKIYATIAVNFKCNNIGLVYRSL